MKRSLAISINRKLAAYLVLVIGILTFACFAYVNNMLKMNSLSTLVKYTEERARFESRLFVDAEKSFELMEEQFFRIRKQHKHNDFDYESRFNELFPLRSDGKLGPRLGFTKERLNKEAGGIVSVDYKIDPLMKEVLVDAYSMVDNLGNAWKKDFFSTYLINAQYLVITQPSDLILQEKPSFSYAGMDIVKQGLPGHNPEKEIRWSALYNEPFTEYSMISAISPLYIENTFVGNLAHDVLLEAMIKRMGENQLPGASFAIVDGQGKMVAHTELLEELKKGSDPYSRDNVQDKEIHNLYHVVDQLGVEPSGLFENISDKNTLAVSKMSGPDWYYIAIYPKENILRDTRKIIWIFLSMALTMFVIQLLLASTTIVQTVIAPLENLVQATEKFQSGETVELVESKSDNEIGVLSRSFTKMTKRINDYSDNLENKVSERTCKLEEAKEKAEAANRAKSLFLANMSHELRTPLNAVLGFSELMASDTPLNNKNRGYLDIINRSGRHLLRLINDILDMSKIEAGKVRIEPDHIDFDTLVRDVVEMIRGRAEQKGLKLILDQSSDFPGFIRGDAPKIRQILINLLSNAVKFTDQGRVTLLLRAEMNTKGLITLRGEVRDTGRGIPQENIDRIFQPFEQLVSTIEQKGTGLGLAITSKYIELMGGTIFATSEPAKGSIFHFTLKVEPGSTERVLIREKGQICNIIGLAEPAKEWRVLIVEDMFESRLLLQQLMEKVGFQVRVAENGEKAIHVFKAWQPHYIWMDMRMPVLDGYKATKQIRKLPGGDQVKIVALTASAFKEQSGRILKTGCDDVLHKPYQNHEIFDIMATQLGVRYLYADDAREAILDEKKMTAIPQMIRQIEPALGKTIRAASMRGSGKQLKAALESLQEQQPEAAAALGALAGAYRYEEIVAMIDGTTEKGELT